VGNTDQKSKINTFNISPTYTHVIGNSSVFNLGAFVRRDGYNYYPSGNPLADLGPSNLQTSSISQNRTLTNAAVHSDYSYVKGVNNLKAGVQYGQTFLREHDGLGIVDPTYNSPCVNSVTGVSLSGYANPTDCPGGAVISNANYLAVLGNYDEAFSITTPAAQTSRNWLSLSKTRSRPATGSSIWGCARMFTTA
jgi:hypothetical protein